MTEKNEFIIDNPIMYDSKNGRCRCVPIPYKSSEVDRMAEKLLVGGVPRCGKVVSQEKLIEDLKREGKKIKVSEKNNDDELDALSYAFEHVKKVGEGCQSFEKENGRLRFTINKLKRENKKLKNEKLSLERENEKLNGRVQVITREYMDWKFSARKFNKKYQSAVKLLRVIKHELMTLNNLRLVDSNNDLVYVNFNDLLEKIEEVMK